MSVVITKTKAFSYYPTAESLGNRIDDFCNDNDIELKGISYSSYITADGSIKHNAILWYSVRKLPS